MEIKKILTQPKTTSGIKRDFFLTENNENGGTLRRNFYKVRVPKTQIGPCGLKMRKKNKGLFEETKISNKKSQSTTAKNGGHLRLIHETYF